jgi:cytidyltransferase-like protein|tara:strand:+ start:460 stop:804 length:345 start_codon:yes stop_codon:yes gene_type:complete
MTDNRYSMFIGRFQPFHDGHRWLIEQRLKLGKKVCIAVMDIHETEPDKNPYTYYEVMMKISEELSDLLNEGKIKIISIPPIESINYGRDVGYGVIEHLPPEDIKNISATKIRTK